jgi:hypothetical protein
MLARRSSTKRRLTRHNPKCTFRLNIYLVDSMSKSLSSRCCGLCFPSSAITTYHQELMSRN